MVTSDRVDPVRWFISFASYVDGPRGNSAEQAKRHGENQASRGQSRTHPVSPVVQNLMLGRGLPALRKF